MSQDLYYLALPYQGSDEEKAVRRALSLQATTRFLEKGVHVFAPILYVNHIAAAMDFDSIEARRAVIMPYLHSFLRVSKGMILVEAEGWQSSWGVAQEVEFCLQHQIPIFKIAPQQLENCSASFLAEPLTSQEIEALFPALQKESA